MPKRIVVLVSREGWLQMLWIPPKDLVFDMAVIKRRLPPAFLSWLPQNVTTERIDSPECIRSNARLMS
jgi:hypothetical protein